jgi:hypothetical protein
MVRPETPPDAALGVDYLVMRCRFVIAGLALRQFRVFRVPFDIAGDETADWHDAQPLGARPIESGPRQQTSDTSPLESGRHTRVGVDDLVLGESILEDRSLAFEVDSESILIGLVYDFCLRTFAHRTPSVGETRVPRRSIHRQTAGHERVMQVRTFGANMLGETQPPRSAPLFPNSQGVNTALDGANQQYVAAVSEPADAPV